MTAVDEGQGTSDGAWFDGPNLPAGVGGLEPWVEAGVLDTPELQVAAAVARLVPECRPSELLAVALAARAPRFGHVCLDLADLTGRRFVATDPGSGATPGWPSDDEWRSVLGASPVVADAASARAEPLLPLVWDDGRLYLQRYWCDEVEVAGALAALALRGGDGEGNGDGASGGDGASRGDGALGRVLDRLFPDSGRTDAQRTAVARALEGGVSIVAGGPGTGKTYTVARLLVAWWLLAGAPPDDHDRVALVAPTGKAAARMAEAVAEQVAGLRSSGVLPADGSGPTVDAGTIHRLLGPIGRNRFRHHDHNPLPHDLVVVDETSMVSLPLMARLIGALGPRTRLVLVGDPFQLASIEAGSVMRDLVGPSADGPPEGGTEAGEEQEPASGRARGAVRPSDAPATTAPLAGRVTVLSTVHRFSGGSGIADLAAAVRAGRTEEAVQLLRGDRPDLVWVDPGSVDSVEEVVGIAARPGVEQVRRALAGDAPGALAASRSLKVLAATRRGPGSVAEWTTRLERVVADEVVEFQPGRVWHGGRPVLVTANDTGARVFNGDTGVVVATPRGLEVALDSGDGLRLLAPSRLEQAETWWAMTIHKSQGSEYPTVVVSLPPAPSPILTRELLYTAVTRAREHLVVVADEASVRAAIGRPLARASGLGARLWPTRPDTA